MSETVIFSVFFVIILLAAFILTAAGLKNPAQFLGILILSAALIFYLSSKSIQSQIQNYSTELTAKIVSTENKKDRTFVNILFSEDAETNKLIFEEEKVKRQWKADYDAEYESDKAVYGEDDMYEYDIDCDTMYAQAIENDEKIHRAKIKIGENIRYPAENRLEVIYNTKNFGIITKDEFDLLSSTFLGKTKLIAKNIGFSVTSGMKTKEKNSFIKLGLGFMFFFLAVLTGCLLLSLALAQITAKTQRVEGWVVEIKQAVHRTSQNKSNRTREILVDIPVYEYEFDGKIHRLESDIARNIGTPHIGDRTQILINADGLPFEKNDLKLFILMGFCFLSFGSLLIFLMFTGVIKAS